MKVGLLIYDDNPKLNLAEKVQRAATRYRRKYGQAPDVCYVHKSAIAESGKVRKVGGVEVRPGRAVLAHHFWLGKDDRKPKAKA